jgi:hypothetical protein
MDADGVNWGTVAALGAFLAFAPSAASAGDGAAAPVANETAQQPGGLLSECDGDCAVSLFGGQQLVTRLPQIVFGGHVLPWEWQWGNSQLLGGSISRRVLTMWNGDADLEPELGFGKRIGDMHTDETWLALNLRWNRFPWNDYVLTSVAFSLGLNAAADLPPGSHAATFYNDFSPQVTFALPEYPRYQLLVQLHHRSNFGLWTATDPGWQYFTVGVRHQF